MWVGLNMLYFFLDYQWRRLLEWGAMNIPSGTKFICNNGRVESANPFFLFLNKRQGKRRRKTPQERPEKKEQIED